ncbi:hypothetical protein Cgig2_017466 [Carnegiea gigantea]|uniref:Uncharacterized protein n=1 Tax=Carnegiea gigantea TaxID=171969 RepID=A0A9Q1GYR7_9CARY|nr:hypothetical protein Cgig2_017466 [Carnegiea gigantea]
MMKQLLMNLTCMYLVVCILEMCYSWLRIMHVLAEMELVTSVKSKFKGVHPNGRQCVSLRLTCALTLTAMEEDLQECLPKLIPASWLRGLIHEPGKGLGSTGNLAMDLFTELLHRRQRTYPNLCWMLVFLKRHMSVTLHNKRRISGIIWDSFKATPQPDRSFLVYDSLPSPVIKGRQELVDSAVSRLCVLWLNRRLSVHVHYLTYVVENVRSCEEDCFYPCVPLLYHICGRKTVGCSHTQTPRTKEVCVLQSHDHHSVLVTLLFASFDSGHNCRVFVMAFMDLLSLKVDGFEFNQDYVAHYRDNPVIVIATHTHHGIRIDNLSSTHAIHGDSYMELATSIAGGGVVDAHPYTPLYKVDLQKGSEVEEKNSCHILEVCA